jgi:hypothetical protein
MSISIEEALYKAYITELGEINSIQTVSILNDYSVYYVFTRNNMFKLFNTHNPLISSAFTFKNRYSLYKFQGIMLDSRAAGISLANKPQVQALQKKDLTI